MKEIRLTLNPTWFKTTKLGTRKADYRDITPFYCSRLCKNYDPKSTTCRRCKFDFCRPTPKADTIHFTLGYPAPNNPDRHLYYRIKEIRKGRGNWLFGATPSRKQFIIDLEPIEH